MNPTLDHAMLRRAALAGYRGFGRVEPNPMVGCVIGHEDGTVLGIGHHRQFGGAHAEVEALANARARGRSVRGATVWVTLEPCAHTGKTPPCVNALIEAGVSRVVAARLDPNPAAAGGLERLRAAGLRAELFEGCEAATALSDAFVKRITLDRPRVIAKWAQTIDGYVATRTGDSKWISGPASRRAVHALRGRVDAIVTGIGTVRADDPLLTARGVRARRIARRVVIDPRLEIAVDSALVRTAADVPVIVATARALLAGDRAEVLTRRGVALIGLGTVPGEACGELDLRELMMRLARDYDASNVLVEAGPRLVGRLLRLDLIDEARVFVAALILGDERGMPPARGAAVERIAAAGRLTLRRVVRRGEDVMMVVG